MAVNGVRLHYVKADQAIRCYSSPGGLRCVFEIYRATLKDGEQNRESAKRKLKMPVLAGFKKWMEANRPDIKIKRTTFLDPSDAGNVGRTSPPQILT